MLFGIFCIYGTCSVETDRFMMCYSVTKFTDGSQLFVDVRNIAMFLPEQVDECSEDKSLDILQYIQANIYKTGKIRAKDISQHFGISENYLGRYIKKHTNETMQQYILNYKLKLVENRLLHSQMRICEIVEELGFTDESHLNKFFKKYRGCSPSNFRKNNLK